MISFQQDGNFWISVKGRRARVGNSVASTILHRPSDYYPITISFSPFKIFWREKNSKEASVNQALLEFFVSKSESFYRNEIHKLSSRWEEVISNDGNKY